ncbi:hypothetical protein ACQYAD_12105 [Neobacillus sp. SM06]|uniref:hypothetical protein n=1 Tax=Neobacillus sp. SM06 TaxID=3422492 RepID=UPI003D2A46B6
MVWTLAVLFGISAILLILSSIKSLKSAKEEQKRMDLAHIALVKDINDLQDSIRTIELSMEIILKEAGIQLSQSELQTLREVLDLYKRGYSIESIAKKKQVSESEISQMLAPFQIQPEERGKVANEI